MTSVSCRPERKLPSSNLFRPVTTKQFRLLQDRVRGLLLLKRVSPCSVHEADCPGKFKLRDISHTGRVVLLPLPPG